MTPTSFDTLVTHLLAGYFDLRRRLAQRLGSIDLANEALQDTYIRLRASEGLSQVDNPNAYLFRIALNAASNRRRTEARHLSASEVDSLIDLPDEAPSPYRITEARSTLAAVKQALQTLPDRRRRIFRRVWVDGASHAAVADEFGIAVRTVRHELQLAAKHLHAATENISVAELQRRLSQVSTKGGAD